MKKRWTMLLMLVLSIGLLAACGSSEGEDSSSESGSSEKETFVVGLEAAYPPFNWSQNDDSNGAVKMDNAPEYAGGYDVEIAKRIAEGLGKELVIVKSDWEGLIPSLNSGKIDAVIAGMSPTAERKEAIDFTDSYYKSDLVMVVKKGSPYENATSIQDFSGAKVTGQLNTFHYSVIDQIEGVSKVQAMNDFSTMRIALETDKIDGYVSERPEAISATAANDSFTFVEFEDGFETSEEDTAIAVGVKKGSDLTEKINEILAEISEEERQEIMDAAIQNQPAAK